VRAAPSSICIRHRPSAASITGPAENFVTSRLGKLDPKFCVPMVRCSSPGLIRSSNGPGHTAIYDSLTGIWTVGPVFPNGDNAGDSFAALLPNGNVLVEGDSGTSYEFDGTKLTPGPQTFGSLMVLPTGEVLVGGGVTQTYTSSGTYQTSWEPAISTYPSTVTRGSTYSISGTQFNGLSQAAAFGDELETATNYPLVRITNKARNTCSTPRTHDHSTMGVATGTATVSTTSTCRRRWKRARVRWRLWRTAFLPCPLVLPFSKTRGTGTYLAALVFPATGGYKGSYCLREVLIKALGSSVHPCVPCGLCFLPTLDQSFLRVTADRPKPAKSVFSGR
jgi:hypothetical protein